MATTWVEKRDRRREVSLHDRVVCPTAHGIGFARAGGPANAHPLSEELFWEGQALRAMNRHQPRILTLMIAAIAVAIAVKGRGPQAEIRARAFVLVDDSGEVPTRGKVKALEQDIKDLKVSRENYFYSLLDARYRQLIAKTVSADRKGPGSKTKPE